MITDTGEGQGQSGGQTVEVTVHSGDPVLQVTGDLGLGADIREFGNIIFDNNVFRAVQAG